MFKLLVILSLALFANANNLTVQNGEIKAHTEVFGDSEINPTTKSVKADLTMENSIESIKGKIYFETLTLISDKKSRDEHMYELLQVEKFKTISFDIKSITKNESDYEIKGALTLNGVTKNIKAKIIINQQNNQISLNGGFSFNLTDFNLEPPKMMFLTVRNQIDITYNISLNEVK
ncbi:MAG: YceI family protein [Aliarcobacter sp.]|nr:YceI family protein [Aliarcobacter sp.]